MKGDMKMQKFGIIIPGQPATKKNSGRIIRVGNFPRIVPSAAYMKYEKHVREQINLLRYQHKIPHYTMPVNLCCRYWLQSYAHWPDLMGLLQATADIISDEMKIIGGRKTVACQWLLADDCIVRSTNGSQIMGVDKYNPRAEVVVTPLEVNPETECIPFVRKQIKQRQAQSLF